ncbi:MULTISPECIES: YihY/virulence factor BrkB family protein [unclassified Dinoroseobacter]|uniref:YihY/virulence factor BrkB family protein n=1 Tax=unclassified Dinoroseobacter TaxID=2620028 RepID=UPI003C7D90C6
MRIKTRVAEERLSLVAAGVAFFSMLALFPAVTAMLAIGGLLLEPGTILAQMEQLRGIVPPEVLDIVIGQATEVSTSDGLGWALLISIGLALWSASRGVNTLFVGLNIAYDEEEKRGFAIKTLQVIGVTVLAIIGAILASLVLAILPAVLTIFSKGGVAFWGTQILAWMVMLGSLTLGLAIVYRFGPSRTNAQWRWLSPGSIFASIGWVLASIGFTLYVANFASYNESFGALAGVIILLLWLWLTSFVILVGGQLNAEIEHQTKVDTTVGDPKPMGERGATMADTLGEAQAS